MPDPAANGSTKETSEPATMAKHRENPVKAKNGALKAPRSSCTIFSTTSSFHVYRASTSQSTMNAIIPIRSPIRADIAHFNLSAVSACRL
eukprot:6739025-Pyramimonas_sp.AAC.1